MHFTVDRFHKTLLLRKRLIWMLRRITVKDSLLLANKLSSLRLRMKHVMLSSKLLHQRRTNKSCHSESQSQATVALIGEFRLIMSSVWHMLRHARWPVKVLAKSTKRRVKLSRRPASGTTNSESDCEYLAVKWWKRENKWQIRAHPRWLFVYKIPLAL